MGRRLAAIWLPVINKQTNKQRRKMNFYSNRLLIPIKEETNEKNLSAPSHLRFMAFVTFVEFVFISLTKRVKCSPSPAAQ